MGGVSVQLSDPNFVNELVDCRFIDSCQKTEQSFDTPPHPMLMCDVGQELRHQLAGAATIMLGGPKLCSYKKDRCAIAEEHFRFQGWGNEIDLQCVVNDPIAALRNELAGAPAKKRRGKKPEYTTKRRSWQATENACLIWLR